MAEIKMYGYKGEIEEVKEKEFKIKIDNKEVYVVIEEEWDDTFEMTPKEAAFMKALDKVYPVS